MRGPLGWGCLLAGLIGASAGCSDDPTGRGDVTVTVYGEAFIEAGIPAEAMADGWAVTFDRFVVTVDDVVVGGVAATNSASPDLAVATGGAGHPIASLSVPEGKHTGARFALSRIELAGSASKDGVTKRFEWAFDQPTRFTGCETTTTVADGGQATFEITVHADHFFYDSLVSEAPAVVFQALADADADGDGDITQAELEAADIGGYDPGSAGGVGSLWAWLVAQSQSVGHVDGEGHCDAEPLAR